MLDENNFSKVPVQALMQGAILYKGEVAALRHNLRFGLNQVAEIISELKKIDHIEWERNVEWPESGPCKYGHVYQIFLSKGINLAPILENELGARKRAVELGLLSRQSYQECASSYGL